jgi:actin-like ATPase involved in cell morphogenesis
MKDVKEFVEGMMSGMHGEDDFQTAIVNYIKEKYSNLVNNKEYDKLGAIIEKDFPSLRSDLILQEI